MLAETCDDFKTLLKDLEREGKNAVIDANGKVSEPKIALANNCAISYVNCRTKETEIVILKPGETFAYGDWNGTRCVRKTYTC